MSVCALGGSNVSVAARKILGLVRGHRLAAAPSRGNEAACHVPKPYELSAMPCGQDQLEEPEFFGGLLTF